MTNEKNSSDIVRGAHVLDLCEGNDVRRRICRGHHPVQNPDARSTAHLANSVNDCEYAFQELQFLDNVRLLD